MNGDDDITADYADDDAAARAGADIDAYMCDASMLIIVLLAVVFVIIALYMLLDSAGSGVSVVVITLKCWEW